VPFRNSRSGPGKNLPGPCFTTSRHPDSPLLLCLLCWLTVLHLMARAETWHDYASRDVTSITFRLGQRWVVQLSSLPVCVPAASSSWGMADSRDRRRDRNAFLADVGPAAAPVRQPRADPSG
jgi:hypothetical protein